MATVSITVPDGVVTRVQTAMVATYGNDAAFAGLTPTQLSKAVVARFVRDIVTAYEVQTAAATAQASTIAQDASDFAGIT